MSSSAPLITKRLHISGLTSQISQTDLINRLSTFGEILALDGFGARDANGDLKKFAYVTMKGTEAEVKRCLNHLSGSFWKGAKFRVGEAKPDYQERIAKENALASLKRSANEMTTISLPLNNSEMDLDVVASPSKRRKLSSHSSLKPPRPRRGTKGFHASDMSPATLENVRLRPGWIVTPLGRLVRVVKMRPSRPLGTLPESVNMGKVKGKVVAKLKMKSTKTKKVFVPTRARRRMIDPTVWGSTYLKGSLLENSVSVGVGGGGSLLVSEKETRMSELNGAEDDHDSDESEDEESDGSRSSVTMARASPQVVSMPPSATQSGAPHSLPSTSASTPAPPIPVHSTANLTSTPEPRNLDAETDPDIKAEATRSLALLSSLFGNRTSKSNSDIKSKRQRPQHRGDDDGDDDDEDWGGQESLSDLDVDIDTTKLSNEKGGTKGGDMRGVADGEGAEWDFEVVPRSVYVGADTARAKRKRSVSDDEDGDVEVEVEAEAGRGVDISKTKIKTKPKADISTDDEEDEDEDDQGNDVADAQPSQSQPQSQTELRPKRNALKDMFVPREEDAQFSLLGTLGGLADLDLEMDEDVIQAFGGGSVGAGAGARPQTQPQTQAITSTLHQPVIAATTISNNNRNNNRITFDASKPLFFPTPSDTSDSSTQNPPTILTYLLSRSLDTGFCRTQSSEEIKAEWEGRKAELTSTWKKAWKNASRRGKRGGHAER